MVSVFLDFVPPDRPGFVKLHIFEAPSFATVPGTEIEVVTSIGTYPNYIGSYTTQSALSLTDWFSIQWEDAQGAFTDVSAPIQGGTTTLVGKIVSRILLRDATLVESIVTQEVEAVISEFLNVADPYSVDVSTVSLKVVAGLTYLGMARSYIAGVVAQAASSDTYVAGLVSQSSGSSSGRTSLTDQINWLLDNANSLLGTNFSVIMVMEDIDPTGIGTVSTVQVDQSRLLLEIE